MRAWILLLFLFSSPALFALDLSRVEMFLAGRNLAGAQRALQEEYEKATSRDDKEQLQYMMAQVALRRKDPEKAISIYRQMLADNPALLRVRCELAYLYFEQKEDDASRYHARLALADKNLPEKYRKQLQAMLSALRRRRAWQLYASIGMVPDSNVNNMSGKRMSCVTIWGMPFCQELEDTEDDLGLQGYGSLSYIHKLSDSWGLKGRLSIDAIDYQDDRYSFWGFGTEIGPRYITEHNEYVAGASYRQQWNDEHRYSYSYGGFAEWNGDLSRKWAVRMRGSVEEVNYLPSDYSGFDGQVYNWNGRLMYGINNVSYAALSVGLSYEHSDTNWNRNLRQRYGLGYGRELPWGFNIYAEPNITFTTYQHDRYFISAQQTLEELTRHDILYGVYVSISNKKLRVWDIMPTVNFVFHHRHSNVYNYGYERFRWEIGLTKSF